MQYIELSWPTRVVYFPFCCHIVERSYQVTIPEAIYSSHHVDDCYIMNWKQFDDFIRSIQSRTLWWNRHHTRLAKTRMSTPLHFFALRHSGSVFREECYNMSTGSTLRSCFWHQSMSPWLREERVVLTRTESCGRRVAEPLVRMRALPVFVSHDGIS